MNSLYLDTNFFIYLSDKISPFYKTVTKFLKNCKANNTSVVTSAETIQEIIHLAKNTKQLDKGLKMAKNCLKVADTMLPVNKDVIRTYLKYASVYKNSGSRDIIQLAVYIENKIDKIVTFDRDFAKFKEIKIFDLI